MSLPIIPTLHPSNFLPQAGKRELVYPMPGKRMEAHSFPQIIDYIKPGECGPFHTVVFYNIPNTVSKDDFEKLAISYGDIMNIYLDIEQKGQAFVTYFDIRNAENCVKNTKEKIIWNRKISTDFVSSPPVVSKMELYPISAAVLVKTATSTAKAEEDHIVNAMRKFGDIRSTDKIDDRYIINYYDIRSAKDAIIHSSFVATECGQTLLVELYKGQDQRRKNRVKLDKKKMSKMNQIQPNYQAQYPLYPQGYEFNVCPEPMVQFSGYPVFNHAQYVSYAPAPLHPHSNYTQYQQMEISNYPYGDKDKPL